MGTDPNALMHACMQPAIALALPAARMLDEARQRSTEALRTIAIHEGVIINMTTTAASKPSLQGSLCRVFHLSHLPPHTRTSGRNDQLASPTQIATTMPDTETATETASPSALEVASHQESPASLDVSYRIVHELVSDLVKAVASEEEEETAQPTRIDARHHKYTR